MSFSKLFVGFNAEQFTFSDEREEITGVRVILTDDTSVLEGSEDSVMEVYIPLCTDTAEARTFAQGILAALSGFKYQPYDAGNVIADPAAQLGDGITINGVYSSIFRRISRLDVQTTQDASAPMEEEVNHEFPWISGADRKAERKYTDLKDDLQSEIDVQAGLISAKVSKLSPDGQTTFSWDMSDTSHVWKANGTEVFRLDATGAHVKGEITATSGVIGGCTISGGVLKVGSANITSIQIGTNFSVDQYGNMIANNASITGTLRVGGNLISASDMYTGASQSAINHGSWSTGTYYAYSGAGSYYYASQVGSASYQSYFNCGQLNHHNAYMTYNGHILQLLSIYVGSTQYYFLGYIP